MPRELGETFVPSNHLRAPELQHATETGRLGGIESEKAGYSRFAQFHRETVRFFASSPLAIYGLIIIILLLVVVIIGPHLLPYDPLKVDLSNKLQPPSWQHLAGTDEMGRDVFSRIVAGGRLSLAMAAWIISVAVVIGVVVGAIAGMAGGIMDDVLMRITDVFLALPALVLAMAIAAALGPNLRNTVITVALVWWPWYARLVRGTVLATKRNAYVEAARAIGRSELAIAFKHILPNCISSVIVQASLDTGFAILLTASLSFIGLGVQPPYPEWGAMVSAGRDFMLSYWWIPTLPGLAIFISVLGFNLLGDALRDYLDPRRRRNAL